MKSAVRTIAGVVIAAMVAFMLVLAVEGFSAVVHPFPDDFAGTEEEVLQHVARYPQWVLAVVVPAWGLTTWLSTWIAKRIGGRLAAWLAGLLLVALLVLNLSLCPYPLWFKGACLVAMPLAIALALRSGKGNKSLTQSRRDAEKK